MTGGRSVSGGRRRGFALLAVLWVVVTSAAIAVAMTLAARATIATARNRIDFARARWQAAGCAERARLAADRILSSGATADAPGPTWRSLDVRMYASSLLASAPCKITVLPVGATANVNILDAEMLGAILVAAGVTGARNDSLVDALLDWRDPDDVPRARGAEREWYDAHSRPGPRNGPLADTSELRLIRGFENLGTGALLGVEPGRIALSHASPALLAALPGMSAEAAAVVVETRARGGDLDNLLLLLGARLSSTARDALRRGYVDLTRLTTPEPEGWFVSARASPPGSRVVAEVELKLVRAGMRAAVVRRRTQWR